MCGLQGQTVVLAVVDGPKEVARRSDAEHDKVSTTSSSSNTQPHSQVSQPGHADDDVCARLAACLPVGGAGGALCERAVLGHGPQEAEAGRPQVAGGEHHPPTHRPSSSGQSVREACWDRLVRLLTAGRPLACGWCGGQLCLCVKQTFEAAVLRHLYPRTQIDIHLTLLQVASQPASQEGSNRDSRALLLLVVMVT